MTRGVPSRIRMNNNLTVPTGTGTDSDGLLQVPDSLHSHSMSISDEPVANLSRCASFQALLPEGQGSSSVARPLDLFDWKHGKFRSTSIPLWLRLSVKMIISILLTVLPPVLTYYKLVPDAYPLISLEAPVKPTYLVEILRACWLLGSGLLAYHSIHVVLCTLTLVTYRTGQIKNVGVDDTIRQSIEQTLVIRRYFCTAAMGITLAIFSKILYPQPSVNLGELVDLSKSKKVDIQELSQGLRDYLKRTPQFFIANGCLAFGIIAVIWLVEKLIVKALARHYMNHSLASRIADNKFARKLIRSLRQHFLAEQKGRHGKGQRTKAAQNHGSFIFDCINKEILRKEDFYPLMEEEAANRFWSLLDVELYGSFTRDQFILAVDAVYHERGAIDRAFLDQSHIIAKVDSLLMILIWSFSFAVVIFILQPPVKFLITFVLAAFGSLAFMFQSAVKDAFNSIMFILFTHPFDCDDMVMIEENVYQVHELGLWTTTFVASDGKLVYIGNKRLLSQPIVNLRRSPIMNESVMVSVLPDVPLTKIQTLEDRLKGWLKENEREFVPSLMIKGFRITDKQHMMLEIPLAHRANFSDQTRKDMRTRKFVLYLKEAIQELGIELSPPIRS